MNENLKLPNLQLKDISITEKQLVNEVISSSTNIVEILSGPTYANGNPHLGTCANILFKDVLNKLLYLCKGKQKGLFAIGWDKHGIPIVKVVEKEFGELKNKTHFIEHCKEVAEKNEKIQKKIFIQLGIEADKCYSTNQNDFISFELLVLESLYKRGYIYCDEKPICRCLVCKQAISISDIVYNNLVEDSIYIAFPLDTLESIIVWTTTPWTLVCNAALVVSSKLEYVKFCVNGKYFISSLEFAKKYNFEIMSSVTLDYLLSRTYDLSFLGFVKDIKTKSIISDIDFVETNCGSGVVHLSPTFGLADYELCKQRNIASFSLIDDLLTTVLNNINFIDDLNNSVIEKLSVYLFKKERITHRYPFCARCGHKAYYITSLGCFIKFQKDRLISALSQIKVMPEGHKTFLSILTFRNDDWCISRERIWGVPLPLFKCKECLSVYIDLQLVEKIRDSLLLPNCSVYNYLLDTSGITSMCSTCGMVQNVVINTVLDVWFDSSVVSLYFRNVNNVDDINIAFEGNDQYRGWFQHSLILSSYYENLVPFSVVFAHGFLVDTSKTKLSKSKGNSDIFAILKEVHPDTLRIFAICSNFSNDITIHDVSLKEFEYIRKKLFLFMRFLSGIVNTYKNENNIDEYSVLESYFAKLVLEFHKLVFDHINELKIHIIFRNFLLLIEKISSIYFMAIKPILYTKSEKSLRVQQITSFLSRMFSFLLPYINSFSTMLYRNLNESYPGYLLESEALVQYFQNVAMKIDQETTELIEYVLQNKIELNKLIDSELKLRNIKSINKLYAIITPKSRMYRDTLEELLNMPVSFKLISTTSKCIYTFNVPKHLPDGIAIYFDNEMQNCSRCKRNTLNQNTLCEYCLN